jgi:CheY-like chemotaxis protein
MVGTMQAASFSVLLVEDDDDNRELLAEVLRLDGHAVEAAADAAEALALVDRRRFDVMVADVGLPGMDGLALAREVRRRHPQVGVVAVSGWDGGDVTAAVGRELDAVVTKPADPAKLGSAMAAAVRARRSAP